MEIFGVISEYNPFHNGHQKQFRLIREASPDAVIACAMSGDFVQRGEPALYPKLLRAETAVRAGADLVLELPPTCSLRSAEGFAAAGVSLLRRCCDTLSFGCEDTEGLDETAALLLSDTFPPLLREELAKGLSFPAARQAALERLGGNGSLVSKPNNILAVEYCKAIRAQNASLKLFPVRREGDYHGTAPETENPSAEALRQLDDFLPFVPKETRGCYVNQKQYRLAFGERAMLARLRTLSEEEFAAVPFGSEGLWRKVMHAVRSGGSMEEILAESKSPRHTRTRLCRLLMCAYLGITAEAMAADPPYIRALACTARGQTVLRTLRDSGLTVLHPGERPPAGEFADLEARCALLYDLFCEEPCFRAQAPKLFRLT